MCNYNSMQCTSIKFHISFAFISFKRHGLRVRVYKKYSSKLDPTIIYRNSVVRIACSGFQDKYI